MEKIPVIRSSMPQMEEYFDEIRDIWESRWLTNTGPKHQQLQKELEQYLQVTHMSLFANGHLALEAALQALRLKGEVITTPFTFTSTTQAILRSGLTPVFCDIDPETYTMNPAKIEDLITEKTCAILPVHVYGNICDYQAIDRIAQKYDLKVIYDAAHAFGQLVDGVGVGTLGDISMFSFHATKVFHTVEGGGLTYTDEQLGKELAAWRQFGMYGKEESVIMGTNAKMTEFHAAMGLCNLRHTQDEIDKRKIAAERYIERLGGTSGLRLNHYQENIKPNYAYFPVLFDPFLFGRSRDEVMEHLAMNNILTRKYFYPLTSLMGCIAGQTVNPTPIAEKTSRQVLTLPLFADITREMVDKVCDVLLSI